MIRLVNLILLVWLATAALAQVGGLEGKKLTFEHGAARVPVLLDLIGKQTGVRLESSEFFDNEVLVLMTIDTELASVLDQIAVATSGEWKLNDGVYRLVKDAAKVQAEDRSWAQARLNNIVRAQKEAQKTLATKVTADSAQQYARGTVPVGRAMTEEEYRQERQREHSRPAVRAMLRFLGAIEPKILASLGPYERLVFSSRPTPMQRNLPNAGELIRVLNQERSIWAEGATAEEAGTGVEQARLEIARVVIAARKYAFTVPALTLRAYAANGRLADWAEISLYEFDEYPYSSGKPKTLESDEPLPVSETTARLRSIRQSRAGILGSEARWAPLPADLLERVLHPESSDPLDGPLSDGLRALAGRKNLNLIAVLEDDDQDFGSEFKNAATVRPSEIYSYLGGSITESEGWLKVRPSDMHSVRRDRMNRKALGVLLREIESQGRVTRDGLAAFLSTRPLGADKDSLGLTTDLLFPQAATQLWQIGDELTLRLYGSLGSAQRDRLSKGGKLAYQSLTPAQQGLAMLITYGVTNSVRPTLWEDGIDMAEVDMASTPEGLEEPTEILPNSIPPSATLSLASERAPILYAYGGDDQSDSAQTLESLAMTFYYKEHPDMFPWANEFADFQLFQPGKRDTLTLHFQYTEKVASDQALIEDSLAKGRPVSRDKLPADILAALKTEMKKVADMYQGFKPGDFGGNEGEPPPRS